MIELFIKHIIGKPKIKIIKKKMIEMVPYYYYNNVINNNI